MKQETTIVHFWCHMMYVVETIAAYAGPIQALRAGFGAIFRGSDLVRFSL